jgi:predicted phage terminase large subunit-like protein
MNHPNYKRSKVYIEPKSSGLSVVQYMREKTSLNIIADTPPTESKYSRVISCTGTFEAGRVMLYHESDWEDFLFELTQFTPDEKYRDEAVDCLTMATSKLRDSLVNMEDLVL